MKEPFNGYLNACARGENVISNPEILDAIEQRLTNLESLVSLMLTPLMNQSSLEEFILMDMAYEDYFDATRKLGGLRRTSFSDDE